MGLKDHAENGSGHILHLGLGLEYLHIDGAADRQAGSATGAPPATEEEPPEEEEEEEERSGSAASSAVAASSSGGSPSPGEVEEEKASVSDAELESGSATVDRGGAVTGRHPAGGESGSAPAKNAHQPLCRARCVDLGTDGPPDPPFEPEPDPNADAERAAQPPASPRRKSPSDDPPPPLGRRSSPSDSAPPAAAAATAALGSGEAAPGVKDYRAKLEFSLKLGYSEETVRQVLSKLGPDTLINDILGELVKLGTKPADGADQPAGSSTPAVSSASSSSSSSCGCSDSLEGQRSDSPCPTDALGDQDNLRPVVVDGSNVAMSHGNKEVFSCHGIQLAVDWFLERGHHDITVFVPAWRKEQSRPDAPITDQEILRGLEKDKILVFTPSRRVQGRRVVCYDDRFIVKLAYESDGVIVSNDNYRDLANEKPEWKKFVDDRLLMYSFVNDKFMPPDDPLGRHGPSLDNFLRKRPVMPEQKKQPCPYGKKCTYGHKCKYYHPERGAQPQRAVADELRASAKTCNAAKNHGGDAGLVKSHSVPVGAVEARKGAPKRQSDPSVRALSYSDAEDKLIAKGRGESHKASICSTGSSSSSSSSSSSACGLSLTMSPAPGGPPSGLGVPQDQPSRAAAPHSLLPLTPGHDLYRHCESPDLSYYSVSRAYSALSLSSRLSHDCRFPVEADDPRLLGGSAGSECGSESNASCGSSCDSYGERPCPGCIPPDPSLEEGLHYTDPHSRLYAHHRPHSLHHADYANMQRGRSAAPHGYHLARGQSLAHDPPPDAPPPKRPLYPLPPHLQHQPLASRSSCPGDYRSLPHQTDPRPPGSPLGRCLAPARAESVSDSRLYEHLHPHQRQKAFSGWDSYYGPPLAPRYEPPAYQSLPDACRSPWPPPPPAPWPPQDGYAQHRSSHPALHPSPTHPYPSHPAAAHGPRPPGASRSLPPYPPPGARLSAPSHAPPSFAAHRRRPESPAHARYGDAREKTYVDLCNIFPSELVSRVMARSPHVTDPQQLAAAILAEKAQTGY